MLVFLYQASEKVNSFRLYFKYFNPIEIPLRKFLQQSWLSLIKILSKIKYYINEKEELINNSELLWLLHFISRNNFSFKLFF